MKPIRNLGQYWSLRALPLRCLTLAKRILLDTSPLSLLSHPDRSLPDVVAIRQWLRACTATGMEVLVPEIADYELRRELLRVGRTSGLRRLEALILELGYLPIDTATMRRAAELWAEARRHGHVTAPPEALDGDVILAAQAQLAGAVLATENAAHLDWFAPAKSWRELVP